MSARLARKNFKVDCARQKPLTSADQMKPVQTNCVEPMVFTLKDKTL